MERKFVLIGGHVYCDDGDKHYISPKQLCQLYCLVPSCCFFVTEHSTLEIELLGLSKSFRSELIILKPRCSGDYKEHLLTLIRGIE